MILSTIITLCLAEYAARDDYHQIGKGSKIRHGLQWLFRAAVVALACYLDDCVPYAVPLAFLFSAVFRWRLNALRGMDWRYVAPWSSVYDLTAIVVWHIIACIGARIRGFWKMPEHWIGHLLFVVRQPRLYVSNEEMELVVRTMPDGTEKDIWVHTEDFRDAIHRAGTVAYIFEAVCFVVGTVWYIWAR